MDNHRFNMIDHTADCQSHHMTWVFSSCLWLDRSCCCTQTGRNRCAFVVHFAAAKDRCVERSLDVEEASSNFWKESSQPPQKRKEKPTNPNAYHAKETPEKATKIKSRCGVWSVKCGMWSIKCKVWSVKCGVGSVRCKVFSVKCGV